MKVCVIFLLAFAINVSYGQWISRLLLLDAVNYFNQLMQETIFQLEAKGFSNLRLDDVTQSINQQMYKWHVIGNITYTNGFLVSVQKMDVTDVSQAVVTSTVNNVVQTSATITGRLNLRDMKIGYDVLAELGDDGVHRFTGTFVHTLTMISFRVGKNLKTQEMTGTASLDSFSRGTGPMVYMPANNITQVMSRTYDPGNLFTTSVNNWGPDIILPIMLDVARNKLQFPSICLDCR